MTAFEPIGNWQTLVGFVVAVLVVGFALVLVAARDPVTRRIRFGVFLEREVEHDDDLEDG